MATCSFSASPWRLIQNLEVGSNELVTFSKSAQDPLCYSPQRVYGISSFHLEPSIWQCVQEQISPMAAKEMLCVKLGKEADLVAL